MKYALIGCGRIAVNHMKAAINNKLEIVAVCDVLPEKMEALLEKYDLQNDPSIKRYTDYKQMLAENDITLASIATESGIHAQIALYCIDHGVNVIIEKPMAMSMDDAEEIVRRSEEKHVKVTKTASTWPFSRCARLWRPGALEKFPTAPSTFAGTGTTAIMTRPLGGAPGLRMAAAS